MTLFPQVKAELVLAQVIRQVLLRDPSVRSLDGLFEPQPEGFDIVRMDAVFRDVLASRMIDRTVSIAIEAEV